MIRQRGFELVSPSKKKVTREVRLPTRADYGSAGYDFYAPDDYECLPHEVTKIWSDVKAYMQRNEVLLLDIRSSMGGKFHLSTTIGVIDSTYYNNPDNEGNIGLFLVNDTDEIIYIKKDERIAQGISTNYLITDNDKPLNIERAGGFGSSGK